MYAFGSMETTVAFLAASRFDARPALLGILLAAAGPVRRATARGACGGSFGASSMESDTPDKLPRSRRV